MVVEIFCEFCNVFCVCFGFKFEIFGFKESFEFFVVGDDVVVDDGKFLCGVGFEDD